jgi:hypothetical protein
VACNRLARPLPPELDTCTHRGISHGVSASGVLLLGHMKYAVICKVRERALRRVCLRSCSCNQRCNHRRSCHKCSTCTTVNMQQHSVRARCSAAAAGARVRGLRGGCRESCPAQGMARAATGPGSRGRARSRALQRRWPRRAAAPAAPPTRVTPGAPGTCCLGCEAGHQERNVVGMSMRSQSGWWSRSARNTMATTPLIMSSHGHGGA